jgi:Cd2+/Zn2+-exporting ATPase
VPTSVFTIPAMDCPTEEGLIRRRLRTVQGISDLRFDLLGRRLTVVHNNADDALIVAALSDIGMVPAAVPEPAQKDAASNACEDCACDSSSNPDPNEARPWWRKHGLFASPACWLRARSDVLRGSEGDLVTRGGVAVVSILLGGLPTFRKGWTALRTFTLNINFLMTVAIIGGAVIGAWPEIALVTFLFAWPS